MYWGRLVQGLAASHLAQVRTLCKYLSSNPGLQCCGERDERGRIRGKDKERKTDDG